MAVKEELHGCPTCGHELDGSLGLRDYSRWLNKILPGKMGGTDIDCMVERHGHFLGFEFKPSKWVPRGQGITFDALVDSGWTLYVVVDKDIDQDKLLIAQWSSSNYPVWHPATVQDLEDIVLLWLDEVENLDV